MENKSVLTIPHDLEAEQAVLGAIIFNNQTINDIAGILSPNSFHKESHRRIFRAMLELVEINQPIDEILLGDQLKEWGKLDEIGGYAYLAELVDCVPSSGNIVYYAKIIQEHALLRDLISTTSDISRKGRDPSQDVKSLINEAIEKITSFDIEEKKPEGIKDILQRNFMKLEELSKTKKWITGISTGYNDLDRLTRGLQPTDLIVIAARPSVGKTALAVNIGSYVATRGDTKGIVLIFSLEMSKEQLGMRMLISESRIENTKLQTGNLDQEDWDKLTKATDRLSTAKIVIDDRSNITPSDVISTIRKYDKLDEDGVCLVIVDYIQLMKGNKKTSSREQEIAEISRSLKVFAKDSGIPVIALSQLNRALENRSDKRPQLSDLRESGSIEQDADIILFIYRDEIYNENTDKKGIAEIIIRKHRNGPIGIIELAFIGKYTKFVNPYETAKPKFVDYGNSP